MSDFRTKYHISHTVAFLFFAAVFLGAILLSQALSTNPAIQATVAELGYTGVLITAVIAGLNAIFPIPAATLTPLFTEAGLSIPLIILCLTIGTMIADFTGFALGHVSRAVIRRKYPRTIALFSGIHKRGKRFLIPAVLIYAALVPLPNEAILIPLAILGVRFPLLIIPLFIGNLINQTILVYGIAGVAELLQ